MNRRSLLLLSTMLGGLFNSFPYNVYSQNTGLLALSKIKSRYAVAAGGGLLVLLGFLPKLAAVIAAIPLRNSRLAQIDLINDSSRVLISRFACALIFPPFSIPRS